MLAKGFLEELFYPLLDLLLELQNWEYLFDEYNDYLIITGKYKGCYSMVILKKDDAGNAEFYGDIQIWQYLHNRISGPSATTILFWLKDQFKTDNYFNPELQCLLLPMQQQPPRQTSPVACRHSQEHRFYDDKG